MNTMTEKKSLKRKMLAACIAIQQALIDDFRSRIESLKAPQGLGNEESYDSATQIENSLHAAEINGLTELLGFATQEMKILENLYIARDIIRQKASRGAVVVTDRGIFFISVSIEEFEVDGRKYFGISTQSPLYQAMNGKKKGESFTYNKQTYKIKDVF